MRYMVHMTMPRIETLLLLSTVCLAGCPSEDPPAGDDLGGAPADMAAAADQSMQAGNVVVVRDGKGAPVPGVDVVVNDAAGAVVQGHKTGPDGQVAVTVPPGGTVAVFQTDGQSRYIDAVNEPPPGARLSFAAHAPGGDGALPTQLELTLDKVPAGATQVRFSSSCSSGTQGTDVPVLLLTACESRGKYDVVVIAMDDAGKRLGWGALLAQAPRPGETVTGKIPLDRTDFVSIDLAATGVAAGRRASLRLDPRSELSARVPTLADRATALSPPGGRLQAVLTLPALVTEGFRTTAGTTHDLPETAKNTRSSSVSRARSFQALPAMLSEAVDAIPDVTLADPDLGDPAHPRYTWQLAAPFRGDRASLVVEYDAEEEGILRYSLAFPVERSPSLRLPDVPASLSAYGVGAAVLHAFGQVTYTDYDGVTGYAESLDPAKLEASPGLVTSSGTFLLKP
jgi:hypothetical protein